MGLLTFKPREERYGVTPKAHEGLVEQVDKEVRRWGMKRVREIKINTQALLSNIIVYLGQENEDSGVAKTFFFTFPVQPSSMYYVKRYGTTFA